MTIRSFINLIKKEIGTLALILAVLLAITAIITFSQPLRYEASNKLLIQQDVSRFDPYNVFKINEYYNNLIKEIVHSESFFKQVLSSGYSIDSNYFQQTRKEQLKTWDKTVDIVSTDIGTMEIKVYHPKPEEAKQILLAVTDVLVNQSSQYQNLNNNVDIKIINQTTISKYPVKPNIILNFIYTIIISIIISLLYIYYKSEKIYHNINNSNDEKYNNMIQKNDKNTEKQKDIESLKDNENNNNNKDTKENSNNHHLNLEANENDYKKNINNKEINNDKQQEHDNNEKAIKEGEEVKLEEEIEEEADINNLFNK